MSLNTLNIGAQVTVIDEEPKDKRTENKKRLLSASPSSAQSEGKKTKANEDRQSLDELLTEARVMDRDRQNSAGGVDTTGIHETILMRVNTALKGSTLQAATTSENIFLQQIVPALVTAVAVAVGEAMDQHFRLRETEAEKHYHRLEQRLCERIERGNLLTAYQLDKQEQYTRRETIRVTGMTEEKGENVEEKVIKLFEGAGMSVTPEDISICHRNGSAARRGPRPVLIKFVSRKKRNEVMEKKKEMKNKPAFKDIYVGDDLTPLRARLRKYVKDLPQVERVWTAGGRIKCTLKQVVGLTPSQQQQSKPFIIESPDDLFHLGVNELDYAALGLTHLLCRPLLA